MHPTSALHELSTRLEWPSPVLSSSFECGPPMGRMYIFKVRIEYVLGGCNLHCASDMKHNIKEWGTIQGVPPIIGCLENKPTFECHPKYDMVLNKILEIYEG